MPELTDDIAEKEGYDSIDNMKRGVKTKLQSIYEQKEEIRIKEESLIRLSRKTKSKPPNLWLKMN